MATQTLQLDLRKPAPPRLGGPSQLATLEFGVYRPEEPTLDFPRTLAQQSARAEAARTWGRWTTDFAPMDCDESADFLDFDRCL
jgi:hypothetical protein